VGDDDARDTDRLSVLMRVFERSPRKFLRTSAIIISIALVLWAAAAVGLQFAGGAFDHEPSEMDDGLGSEAQRLLASAFEDVSPNALLDHHVHIVGLGTNGTGTWLHPKMLSWADPIARVKALAYLSGSKVTDPERADEQYVARLLDLARSLRGGRLLLLAFDYRHDENGTPDLEHSEFYTPNEYVYSLARADPAMFVPAISVHPHRRDAIEVLHQWADRGVRFVKWLPNTMGIDASSSRHDDYYRVMVERRMVLLAHVGEEQAVEAEEDQKLGNPLLFRRPLDLGVTVVMAHAASLGRNEDLDRPGKDAPNFEFFLRLMDEPRYEGRLYGEISALTQVNRLPGPLVELLGRTELHHRLINGSDYPLPAINILVQTRALVRHGLLTAAEREALNEIYDYNPLLFDYVVKRTIRDPESGTRFPASVFTGADLGPALLSALVPSTSRGARR
jgi:predicted TIM-barrel fold metal-dependent hydrolase